MMYLIQTPLARGDMSTDGRATRASNKAAPLLPLASSGRVQTPQFAHAMIYHLDSNGPPNESAAATGVVAATMRMPDQAMRPMACSSARRWTLIQPERN